MSSVTVIEAENVLAKAKAAAQKQRCEDAKQRIQELRREGAELRKQYKPLAQQVLQAQQDRLRLHAELVRARNQIAVYSVPLDPLDFPSDADVAEHAQQLVLWQKKQAELLDKHRDAVEREAARIPAIALAQRMENVRLEIQNWSTVAEGIRPGQVKGSITTATDLPGSFPVTTL